MSIRCFLAFGAVLAATAASTLWPTTAECAWCPPTRCVSDTSCGTCACLKVGDESTGVCVAVSEDRSTAGR